MHADISYARVQPTTPSDERDAAPSARAGDRARPGQGREAVSVLRDLGSGDERPRRPTRHAQPLPGARDEHGPAEADRGRRGERRAEPEHGHRIPAPVAASRWRIRSRSIAAAGSPTATRFWACRGSCSYRQPAGSSTTGRCRPRAGPARASSHVRCAPRSRAHRRQPGAPRQELAGSPAPLASLHRQAGQLLGGPTALAARLRALRGYPVVINAWASWCGPCREEFSLFASASARYGRRVAFLGADTNDSAGDARTFLSAAPRQLPQLPDDHHQPLLARRDRGTADHDLHQRRGQGDVRARRPVRRPGNAGPGHRQLRALTRYRASARDRNHRRWHMRGGGARWECPTF